MQLAKEVYEALEDVVGPENVTQEPAILDTYNQVWGNKLVFGEKWSIRPAAVLLPGSTEEVQAIVRVCNRYSIPFRPFSSGFEITATALQSEKAVILDLRRMDRILEIDVKNMHAVVEPYVSVYRLQREAAKHGLFIGCVGAGPSTGVIASSCCHFGSGMTQVSTGGLDRNVLGVEWVLPTGDILKLGTAETGAGWFSADGPGLSLRGILRGHTGANGGHGVITKASVKLYPWYGPPEWEFVGTPPGLKQLEKVLDGYRVFVITFPTKDHMSDALREIGQAEIACSVYVLCAAFGLLGEGNDESWENYQNFLKLGGPELLELLNTSLSVVLGARSSREMEYREKCLLRIGEKWGGTLNPLFNDPVVLTQQFAYLMWAFGSIRYVFRLATDFFISPCSDGTEDMINNLHRVALEMIEPHMAKGTLLQADAVFHLPYEDYSVGSHIEHVYYYDPFDADSLTGTTALIGETMDPEGKCRRFGVPALGGGLQFEPVHHVHQRWGPIYDNYDVWLRKIKAGLDPNSVADWGCYIPPVFP